MKKTMMKISAFATIFAALTAVGCSSDDPEIPPIFAATCTDGVQNGTETGVDCGGTCSPCTSETNDELSGDVTEDTVLDSSIEYKLVGALRVKSGATLTIPAGTRIVSNAQPEHYIAVEKGGDIIVQGTESNPVVMTSTTASPGDWGGLLICGNATTTAGIDATAEVGGLIYGGTDDSDNSGSINYLIIEGAGAIISGESQYNGLSLYAVGSGTSINNVAMINGADDGVEFFGGTVSATNLYLENNEDDAVDWTEGWNGKITNTYVLHTKSFSTAIEADKVNANPTIENFTAVSTVGGTALQYKLESGSTITGLSLTGYTTNIDFANAVKDPNDAGYNIPDFVGNVQIDGEDSDPFANYTTPATVDINLFSWVDTNPTIATDVLQGLVSTSVTLDASIAYKLNSSYIVQSGGKLTIPAGTKITAAAGGTSVYIAVLQGGEIDIQGTPENPVVISSETASPSDWGGLTICGNATTTAGLDAVAEIGGFIYGGSDDTDSSGNISNLVIIGTGAQINAESQYNGISFYAVGSGTTVENVAVINGADDGVEFFGGTVSATNLYLENNEDDAVDWTEGWNGTVTNTYVSHTTANFSTAVEADGINGNPSLVNFTAISTTGGTALQYKKESGSTITNIYLEGYDTNVDMRDGGPLANVQIDGAAATTTDDYNTGTQVDISTWTWKDAGL